MNLRDKLLGALVGITRSTNGNESIITKHTDSLVIQGLLATAENATANDEILQEILDGLVEEKKRVIPNCFYCESTCLRKMDYDMQELWNANEEIRSLKLAILTELQKLATHLYQLELQGKSDEVLTELMYVALYSIGMDLESMELFAIKKNFDSQRYKYL